MDIRYDRCIFWGHVHGTHIHHCDCYGDTNCVFQGSYCDCERSESSQTITVYKGTELVLVGDDDVLLVRGKRYLLLQAHCASRQGLTAICDTSQVYQLHALRYW